MEPSSDARSSIRGQARSRNRRPPQREESRISAPRPCRDAWMTWLDRVWEMIVGLASWPLAVVALGLLALEAFTRRGRLALESFTRRRRP